MPWLAAPVLTMPDIFPKPTTNAAHLDHVMLKRTNLRHDPTAELETVRECGTFTNLAAAEAAAHHYLVEAGYKREWFTTFNVRHKGAPNWTDGDDTIVHAVAPGG